MTDIISQYIPTQAVVKTNIKHLSQFSHIPAQAIVKNNIITQAVAITHVPTQADVKLLTPSTAIATPQIANQAVVTSHILFQSFVTAPILICLNLSLDCFTLLSPILPRQRNAKPMADN